MFQLTMNVGANIDYDYIINNILLSEDHVAKQNFIKGTEKSFESSYQQGFQVGYQKGYNIGLEIGFYDGILTAIIKLQKSKIITLSDRELSIAQKLLNLIQLFPQINVTNVDVVDQYNKIKGLYKKFCFNLKVKDLDKSVLHFSKWSN